LLHISIMFRYFAIPFIAITLSACNQPAQTTKHQTNVIAKADSTITPNTPAASQLITPGQAIGQTKIDENADSVIYRLGKPDGGDAAMGKAIAIWYSHHDTTGYQTAIYSERQMGTNDEKPRVKQIRITSPWFVTREGIKVGSTQNELAKYYALRKIARYSQQGQNIDLYDTGKGITFEVNAQNKCIGIVVYDVNRKSPNTYLPFFDNLKPY
jgi:hypothetical protein